MKYAAYVRVSDSKKQNSDTQLADIEAYCQKQGIHIEKWVEEHISASKTDIEDRKLWELVSEGYSIVTTDVTRLDRRDFLDLVSVINQICREGELHFTYTGRVITPENRGDAETIFTIVGSSYASIEEARKRSERAKAAHARRRAQGLNVGRAPGTLVKSKLDEHAAFIIKELKAKTKKAKLVRLLKEQRGVTVSRQQLYRWIDKRLG